MVTTARTTVPALPRARWAVAAGAVFAVCTAAAFRDDTVPGEVVVFEFVNGLPGWPELFVKALMVLGTLVGALVVAVVLAVATRRWAAPLAIALGAAGGRVLVAALKEWIDRPRPVVLVAGTEVRSVVRDLAFPSAHATTITILACVIAWWYPKTRVPVLVVAAGVILGRMYVGVHMPLDLVGGVALGIAIAWVASTVVARVAARP